MKNNMFDKLGRLLVTEKIHVDRLKKTDQAKRVSNIRNELLEHIRAIGSSGNLPLIVATERAFVQNDMNRYLGGPNMKGSLETALEQFDAIERLIKIVDVPKKYAEVDKEYSLRTSRDKSGSLPNDEARQGFDSHYARLNNMTKGRMEDSERQIIEARKTAIREAKKLYIEKQTTTLGLIKSRSR